MNDPPRFNTSSDTHRDRHLLPADFEQGRPHLPVPSPSSSLDPARTAVKRTAEEDPEDQNDRPTKAPRRADPSSPAMAEAVVEPEPALKDLMSRELSCSVCTDIFHQPVTLTPCLHSFCGACAVRWLELQPTCPTCRTRVHSTSPNALVGSLVTSYLSAHPSAQPRDAEEIEALSRLYKSGDKIYINEDGGDSDNSDDEDRHHDEDDDNSDSDDEMGIPRTNPPTHSTPSGLPYHHNFNTVPWPPFPCPCCDPTNSHGYVCPTPLRFPIPTEYLPIHVAYHHSIHNHVICTACTRAIPTGFQGPPDSCGLCGHVSCAKLWDCPARPNGGRGWIDTLEAQEVFSGLTPEELEDPNLIKNTSSTLFNEAEFKIFKQYMVANNLNLTWLSSQFKTFLVRDSPTPTKICKTCISQLWSRKAMYWWVEHKETLRQLQQREEGLPQQQQQEEQQQQEPESEAIKLDDEAPNPRATIHPENEGRPKCWYGYECPTQWHNIGHRDRYNHACTLTAPSERIDINELSPEEREVMSRHRARQRVEQQREFRRQNVPTSYPPPPPPPPVSDEDLERRNQLIREGEERRREQMFERDVWDRDSRERAEIEGAEMIRREREAQREAQMQLQMPNQGILMGGQGWDEGLGAIGRDIHGRANDHSQAPLGYGPGMGRASSYYGEVVDMPDNVELGEQ